MIRLRQVLAVLLASIVVSALAPPAAAKNVNVRIRDNVYDKHFRVILEGDTITWRNDGENEHTVTPYQQGAFPDSTDSRQCVPNPIIGNDPDDCMDPGDTHTVKFSEPGTYEYYCKAHGNLGARPDPERAQDDQPCGMCGVIQVKADQQTSPTVTPTERETRRPSSPDASPTASATASPSPTASPDGSDGSGDGTVASGAGSDDGGGLGRGATALLVILGLSGAGWWTWKKYLATG